MRKKFGNKVIEFNKQLQYTGSLPPGFQVLNPYLDNPETMQVMQRFYKKYYDDIRGRKFIIGINPSRHGAGVTGVPFTDTKRLHSICGIQMITAYTHEVSSVFIYEMIAQYGGAENFFNNFYINSPFPLAIIRQGKNGKWVNANYYDEIKLYESVKPFMIESLKQHISLGLDTDEVYVLGKKNARFIAMMNEEANLFKRIVVLEHPRFIQQYKFKDKQLYIDKYILAFNPADEP